MLQRGIRLMSSWFKGLSVNADFLFECFMSVSVVTQYVCMHGRTAYKHDNSLCAFESMVTVKNNGEVNWRKLRELFETLHNFPVLSV